MNHDNVPMDPELAELVAQCDREAIAAVERANGAAFLFMRQKKLEGPWRIAANRRELERVAQPAQDDAQRG